MKRNRTRNSILRRTAAGRGGREAVSAAAADEHVENGYLLSLICEKARYVEAEDRGSVFYTEEDLLAWCVAVLKDSPLASALLRELVEEDWFFALKDLGNEGFHLDVEGKCCHLDSRGLSPQAFSRSAHFRSAVIMAFARALRDIWHEMRTGAFEQDFIPGDALVLERMRAADGDSVAVFVGWELRCAGHVDVWRYVISSDDGDLAMLFSRLNGEGEGSLFEGNVPLYVFRQWFSDRNRVDACDHNTLERLDEVLAESRSRNPFGTGQVNGRIVEELSRLPGGFCYLDGAGYGIVGDPYYSCIKNLVNKAHLEHLAYDLDGVVVGNVRFRDEELARLIFPEEETVTVK